MGDVAFDGLDELALMARFGLAGCELHDGVGSTMDLAHAAAGRGAPAGTLIVANSQDAGRGRGGRSWSSPPAGGVWMTLIERPASPRGLDVLSLRLGLHLAEALDELAGHSVRLKWPNDLFVGNGKLGGILVEARWRDQRVDWVAIGIGVNVAAPADVEGAAGLVADATRLQAMSRMLPALRQAAAVEGPLTLDEMRRYAARDLTLNRRIDRPAAGLVVGIAATGELLVETDAGLVSCRSGSLVFAEGC